MARSRASRKRKCGRPLGQQFCPLGPRDGLFSVTQRCSMFAGAANRTAVPSLTSSASGQSHSSLGMTAAGSPNTVLRAGSVRGKDLGQPGTSVKQPIISPPGPQSLGFFQPPETGIADHHPLPQPPSLNTITGDAHFLSADGSIFKRTVLRG